MATNNNGIKNENEFRAYLNGKQVKDVNKAFQDMLYYFFASCHENSSITAWNLFSKKKADICIKINDEIRSFSIKMGYKNSVHTEWLFTFLDFLRDIGVDQATIFRLKRYHFADGTIDGTGDNRMSAKEYQELFPEEIKKINHVINRPNIINKVVQRSVTMGNHSKYEIDGLIYGTVNEFIWVSKEEIKRLTCDEKIIIESNGVHFGPLFYQSFGRCLNHNEKYEHLRSYMQFKWYNIHEHMDIIIKKRDLFK